MFKKAMSVVMALALALVMSVAAFAEPATMSGKLIMGDNGYVLEVGEKQVALEGEIAEDLEGKMVEVKGDLAKDGEGNEVLTVTSITAK